METEKFVQQVDKEIKNSLIIMAPEVVFDQVIILQDQNGNDTKGLQDYIGRIDPNGIANKRKPFKKMMHQNMKPKNYQG